MELDIKMLSATDILRQIEADPIGNKRLISLLRCRDVVNNHLMTEEAKCRIIEGSLSLLNSNLLGTNKFEFDIRYRIVKYGVYKSVRHQVSNNVLLDNVWEWKDGNSPVNITCSRCFRGLLVEVSRNWNDYEEWVNYKEYGYSDDDNDVMCLDCAIISI
jgi:hypothetical protein